MEKTIKDYFLEEDSRTIIQQDIQGEYSEKEIQQKEKSFNGLSAKEWASMSKNVWNDLSSPRNKYQLEHGAVFPLKLAERVMKMYSKQGDSILDPFLGIGTTLIASQKLNRHCIGMELNPKFAKIAEEWKNENYSLFNSTGQLNYKIINDDCRNLEKYISPNKIQLTITSPPYADFIQRSIKDRVETHKTSIIALKNNSTVKQYSQSENDFGNLPYSDFLDQIKDILKSNLNITRKGGYSAWVVKDYRDTKNKIPYVPFHSDLARAGEEVGWKYQDLIVWDQTNQRRLVLLGYPSVFYTNQNCSFIVIFRKI